MISPLRTAIAIVIAAAGHAAAQSGPPVRALGPVVVRSSTTLGAVTQAVGLSTGRVLVNDAARRQLLLLDALLGAPRVVLDSARGQRNSYQTGFLIAFRGDTCLYFDRTANAFLVIGPEGTIVRTIAPPSMGEFPFAIAYLNYSLPASSALGLIYRTERVVPYVRPAIGQPDIVQRDGDSSYVLRMHHGTRVVDTVAAIGTGSVGFRQINAERGIVRSGGIGVGLPFVDEVVTTSDGSVAIFHAHEYRIEWIGPDGTRSPGQRTPFAWRPINEDQRQRILDSVNAGRRRTYDSLLAKRAADSAATGSVPMITQVVSSNGETTRRQIPAPLPRMAELSVLSEVPDFYPPTSRGAVLADRDNNVWIRPLLAAPDPTGTPWDIIDRSGRLVDRVRIPIDRTIGGFVPGGFVLLVARDGGVATLEKVRIR